MISKCAIQSHIQRKFSQPDSALRICFVESCILSTHYGSLFIVNIIIFISKKACLTDGWYQIAWHPDPMLTTLITSGKIRVGSKLVTAGAELVVTNPSSTNNQPKRKCSSGDEQIDEFKHLYGDDGVAVGMALKLHGNSTRPVSWCSRLGFTTKQPSSGAGLYPVPLCTLSSDGGICSSIRVVIQVCFCLFSA